MVSQARTLTNGTVADTRSLLVAREGIDPHRLASPARWLLPPRKHVYCFCSQSTLIDRSDVTRSNELLLYGGYSVADRTIVHSYRTAYFPGFLFLLW